MGWSFNPKNIITYFKMYSDLSSYWLKKYPESIYVLDYDKLVNDKDSEIKLLLKSVIYLGMKIVYLITKITNLQLIQ